LLGSPRVKFTWLGSEDSESVVFPPGRPFIAEVKSPLRHALPTRINLGTGVGLVKVARLKRLIARPITIPAFTFATKAFLESGTQTSVALSELNRIRNLVVRYKNNKGKIVFKTVHKVKVLKARGRKLVVEIKLDGGLPVKRFVNGDSVSPSISEVLKTPVRCQRFDILRVWESGGFEFGKV
jgi:tRNA pseudouridine synthase 10